MTGSLPRGPRQQLLAALCAAAGLILAGAARAGDTDNYKATQAVKAQKVLREVKGLIAEARKAESSNPTRARGLLREAGNQLEAATAIPARERTALRQQIRTALAAVQAAINARDSEGTTAADRAFRKKAQEAKRRELETQKKQSGPHGKAQAMIDTGKKALQASDRLKPKRETGFLEIRRAEDRTFSDLTARPTSKAMQAWLDKYRPKGVKLTAKEQAVMKALNTHLTVNFDKTALKSAIEYLQEKTGLNIFVDENSLKDANIEYDDPITFKAKKATVRTVLKRVLGEKGLTFIIKEAAVQVMTPEKASKFTVLRTYPIADLMPTPNPNLPPAAYNLQLRQGAQQLIDLIMTIDPESWKAEDGGGPGTVVFSPTTRTLIIRQSAEFHYQMGGFLDR